MKKKNKIEIKSPLLLGVSILLSHLAGFVGSFATQQSITTWYATLTKPNFNPPNWVFAPVWFILYTLMGISLYLIWVQLQKPTGIIAWFKYKLQVKKREQMYSAVIFFLIHLVVNSIWSLVFFGMKELGAAFAVICLLWIMIATLIYVFIRFSKWAGLLLLPYLAWVTFAGVLNYTLWMIN